MKIVLATTVWRRPVLTRIVLDHYRRVRDALRSNESGIDLSLLAVGSEGSASRTICEDAGFTYLEHENEPVTHKWNAVIARARDLAPDAVVLVNSDDIVSADLFGAYAERFRDGHDYVGLRDSDIFDLATERLGTWPGYEASHLRYRDGEPAGCARGFSRRLLDATAWRLWPPVPEKNSSMDFWCTRFVGLFGFTPHAARMTEIGARAVQVKTDVNITTVDRLPLRDLFEGEAAWARVREVAGCDAVSRLRALRETLPAGAPSLVAAPVNGSSALPTAKIHRIEELDDGVRETLQAELRAMAASVDVPPLVSVVINNHNYARYLGWAIASALAQTHARTEVVVVDDGSTDASETVIASFGERVRAVRKPNGGQASAFNAGIAASRGDIVCFLDADDVCLPHRAAKLAEIYAERGEGPLLVCHRIEAILERGEPGNGNGANGAGGASAANGAGEDSAAFVDLELRALEGDLVKISDPEAAYAYARRTAYLPFVAPPTSGLSMNRALCDRIFPLPEVAGVGADGFLVRGALLTGEVWGTREVLARRRLHETNHTRVTHPHLVDPEFLTGMESYLNDLLAASERERVISVFDSLGATRYYRHVGSVRGLLRLAHRIPSRDPSARAFGQGISSLRAAVRTAMTRARAKRASSSTHSLP